MTPNKSHNIYKKFTFWPKPLETNIKNIRDLISRAREVKSLTEKSRKTDELQRAVQYLLPSMLADYCQVQSFERGVLTLNAATGSAATQLRFVAQQIIPKLQKNPIFKDLEKIQIRIQAPEPVLRTHQVRKVPAVSSTNCQLIRETAESVSDKGLAESLQKLAITLSKNGKD